MNANGRLNVHHIIFKAAFNDLVMFVPFIRKPFPCIFAHAMKSKCLDAGGIRFLCGNDHAAFTGDNIFGYIKTKTSKVTECTRFSAFIFGFNGVRAVFN